MLFLAILPLLASFVASAPQSRIIPEANTYGSQANTNFKHQRVFLDLKLLVTTGDRHRADPGLPDNPVRLRQRPQWPQLPQHRATSHQHFRGSYGDQRADCCYKHGHLRLSLHPLWFAGTQLWARPWPAVLLGLEGALLWTEVTNRIKKDQIKKWWQVKHISTEPTHYFWG